MQDDGWFGEEVAATYDEGTGAEYRPEVIAASVDLLDTIMNLTTQDAQVDCFRYAAAHLRPGGVFLIEVMVPDLRRLPPGQSLVPFRSDATRVSFDEYDVPRQGLVSHHIDLVGDAGPTRRSVPFRYVWPSELDLMARLAGMRLRDRSGGWRDQPFTAETTSHVSVWEKVGDTGP